MKLKFSLLLFCYSILILGSVLSLFTIKSKVMAKKQELNWLNSQISQEENNIRILKAELAYLVTPERINKLQAKYLNLKNIDKSQLKSLEEK